MDDATGSVLKCYLQEYPSAMEWLAPTLALVGVIGTSSIAYAQFRGTERNKKRTQFDSARSQTLQDLVTALTELELHARRLFKSLDEGTLNLSPVTLHEKKHGLATMAEHKRYVNELLIQHRDTLGDEDAGAARAYVEAIEQLTAAMATAPLADQESFGNTNVGFLDPEVMESFVKLLDSHEYLAKQLRKSQGGPNKL